MLSEIFASNTSKAGDMLAGKRNMTVIGSDMLTLTARGKALHKFIQ